MVFWRKLVEVGALLFGLAVFWGSVLVVGWTPFYLCYLYFHFDYGPMSAMARNSVTASAQVTNVTLRHCSEIDEGQVYRWDVWDTSWVADVDGKAVSGVFQDENIPVGTVFPIYYKKGDFSSRTLESPRDMVYSFEQRCGSFLWGWTAPALVCIFLFPVLSPIYKRHCEETREMDRFTGLPRRPPVARIKLLGKA